VPLAQQVRLLARRCLVDVEDASVMSKDDLSAKYPTAYGDVRFECGDGWHAILDELGAVMERHGARASQVKEKFSGLRVYTDGHGDDVEAAIRAAERASLVTCEQCGKPGQRRGGAWVLTLCDGCYGGKAP
jgi:hypothetical protein